MRLNSLCSSQRKMSRLCEAFPALLSWSQDEFKRKFGQLLYEFSRAIGLWIKSVQNVLLTQPHRLETWQGLLRLARVHMLTFLLFVDLIGRAMPSALQNHGLKNLAPLAPPRDLKNLAPPLLWNHTSLVVGGPRYTGSLRV